MMVLLASMPLAWLGSKMETWLRDQERSNYNRLLKWTRNPESSIGPGALILRSLSRVFIVSWMAFYIGILIMMFTFDTLFTLYPRLVASVGIKWTHLWGAATLGGLMALRVKRAYAVLATGAILFVLFSFWSRF